MRLQCAVAKMSSLSTICNMSLLLKPFCCHTIRHAFCSAIQHAYIALVSVWGWGRNGEPLSLLSTTCCMEESQKIWSTIFQSTYNDKHDFLQADSAFPSLNSVPVFDTFLHGSIRNSTLQAHRNAICVVCLLVWSAEQFNLLYAPKCSQYSQSYHRWSSFPSGFRDSGRGWLVACHSGIKE